MSIDPTNSSAVRDIAPILAADVGGTYARVALVRPCGDARELDVVAYRKVRCKDHRSLGELLRAFVSAHAPAPLRHCVVACSGALVGDVVINDTLAWTVRLSGLRATLGLRSVAFLNDFEALGYAFDGLRDTGAQLLCGPDSHVDDSVLVIGPGTGLGAVARLSTGHGVHVLASEAGQMDFAPRTERERAVLARMAAAQGYVSWEHVLSGPGLLRTYQTLCALDHVAPTCDSPEEVTAAVECDADNLAREALGMFCAGLGSFAGNLAMTFTAIGGVFLAGGILPAISDFMHQSTFAERFLDKGGMREFLAQVPVRLTDHGRHGVLGAARWYFDQPRCTHRAGTPPHTTKPCD